MAVPKRRHSKSRRNKRRANFKLAAPAQSTCKNCGAIKLPHRVCPECGNYKGRVAIEMGE